MRRHDDLRRISRNRETCIKWFVYDVDFKTGKMRWQREVATPCRRNRGIRRTATPSETPVTDGERVYAYFGNVGLFAST